MKWVILKEISILTESNNGWRKEVNLIRWNNKEPKYDVRWWSPDRKQIGKGFTFTPDEMILLGEIIKSLPINFHLEV